MLSMHNKGISLQNEDTSFAFLGTGHIAGTLIEAMINQGYKQEKIIATRRNYKKLSEYAHRYGISVTTDNSEAVRKAQVVFLCVRPHQIKSLLTEIIPCIESSHHLVISLVAGLRLETLLSLISCPVARLMPNIAGRVKASVTAFLPSPQMEDNFLRLAQDIAASLGSVVPVEDDVQMDIYTALCGSGVAYIYYYLSLLTNCGTSLGLSPEQSSRAAFHTMQGALHLMKQEGKDPACYLDEIKVPQGTTAAAMDVLKEGSMDKTLLYACRAAQSRSAAIGEELNASLRSLLRN